MRWFAIGSVKAPAVNPEVITDRQSQFVAGDVRYVDERIIANARTETAVSRRSWCQIALTAILWGQTELPASLRVQGGKWFVATAIGESVVYCAVAGKDMGSKRQLYGSSHMMM
jgi:hypothetical protein